MPIPTGSLDSFTPHSRDSVTFGKMSCYRWQFTNMVNSGVWTCFRITPSVLNLLLPWIFPDTPTSYPSPWSWSALVGVSKKSRLWICRRRSLPICCTSSTVHQDRNHFLRLGPVWTCAYADPQTPWVRRQIQGRAKSLKTRSITCQIVFPRGWAG